MIETTSDLEYGEKKARVTLHYCTPSEYDAAYERHGVRSWSWYTKLGIQPRAFTVDDDPGSEGTDVFVRLGSLTDARVAHEIGHVFGLQHSNPFACTTMAFHSLRFRDPEHLRPLGRDLIKKLNESAQVPA